MRVLLLFLLVVPCGMVRGTEVHVEIPAIPSAIPSTIPSTIPDVEDDANATYPCTKPQTLCDHWRYCYARTPDGIPTGCQPILEAPEDTLLLQFQAGGLIPLSLTPLSTRRIATDITQPLFRKTMYLVISNVPRYFQLTPGTRETVDVVTGMTTWRVDGPGIRRVALAMAPRMGGTTVHKLVLTLYSRDGVAADPMELMLQQESAVDAWKNRQQFEPPPPLSKRFEAQRGTPRSPP